MPETVAPLTLIQARTIGIMTMIDDGEKDHKIIAVAVDDPEFNSYREASEMPGHRLMMLRRFFQLSRERSSGRRDLCRKGVAE